MGYVCLLGSSALFLITPPPLLSFFCSPISPFIYLLRRVFILNAQFWCTALLEPEDILNIFHAGAALKKNQLRNRLQFFFPLQILNGIDILRTSPTPPFYYKVIMLHQVNGTFHCPPRIFQGRKIYNLINPIPAPRFFFFFFPGNIPNKTRFQD